MSYETTHNIFNNIKMSEKDKLELKISLKDKALSILHERVNHASSAMEEAQLAANSEDKSTVGDKHETSRSMALLDREIHARQLDSASKDLSNAIHSDVSTIHNVITTGTYVETNNGNYFFLTGIGSLDTESGKIFFLSINSPIGQLFLNKKKNDEVTFNGKKILIGDVF